MFIDDVLEVRQGYDKALLFGVAGDLPLQNCGSDACRDVEPLGKDRVSLVERSDVVFLQVFEELLTRTEYRGVKVLHG